MLRAGDNSNEKASLTLDRKHAHPADPQDALIILYSVDVQKHL